jgi:hypothetical protein
MQSLSFDLKKNGYFCLLKRIFQCMRSTIRHIVQKGIDLKGFEIHIMMKITHNNDYDKIEEIFKSYFNLYLKTLKIQNQSFGI